MTRDVEIFADPLDELATAPPVDPWLLYIEAWLTAYPNPNTKKAYRTDAVQWTAWCEGEGVHPLRIRRVVADRWHAHMIRPEVEGGLGRQARSVGRKLAAIASLYVYLVREEVLEHSPLEHIERPRVDRFESPTGALTLKQAEQLVHAAAGRWGTRGHAAVELLLCTGWRSDELLSVDVEDLVRTPEGLLVWVTRKRGKRQQTPIEDPSLVEIVLHLAGDRPRGQLMAGPSGRAMSYDTLHRMVTSLAGQGDIPDGLTPHWLRATFITRLLEAGVEVDAVREAAGHSSGETTAMYDKRRGILARVREANAQAARLFHHDIRPAA